MFTVMSIYNSVTVETCFLPLSLFPCFTSSSLTSCLHHCKSHFLNSLMWFSEPCHLHFYLSCLTYSTLWIMHDAVAGNLPWATRTHLCYIRTGFFFPSFIPWVCIYDGRALATHWIALKMIFKRLVYNDIQHLQLLGHPSGTITKSLLSSIPFLLPIMSVLG